jgi:hypothetical protein
MSITVFRLPWSVSVLGVLLKARGEVKGFAASDASRT